MNRADRRRAKHRKGPLMLECGEHGRSEWRADVVCSHCGERWQMRSPAEARYAPEVCSCGVRLVGDGSAGVEFSARAICASCAREPGRC